MALDAGSSQDSRGAYLKNHLIPYFGQTAVSAIGEKDFQEFITRLTQCGLEPQTVETIVATLKRILGKKAWRDWSLTLPKTLDKEQRFFTADEMLGIVGEAKGKWKLYFALLSDTGLRFGESAGLHVEDLDSTECKIHVRRGMYRDREKATKTRAGFRAIDISAEVVQMLKDHIGGRTTGRMFETRAFRPLNKDNVRHALHRILARLKIQRGGLRAFRHGSVSILQASRVPPDLIKTWVGHTNLKTTSIYTHFQDSYRREVAQQVGIFTKQCRQVEPKLPFGPKPVNLDPSLQKFEYFQSAVTQGVSW